MSPFRPRLLRAAFAAVVLVTLSALAGPYPNTSFMGDLADRNADWYQRCMAVEHAQAPAADLRVAAPKAPCDPTALYYDTRALPASTAADWAKVRECAVARQHDMVLMMLYANGYGVKQDLDLATRYACSLDQVAPAEMESRVAHLSALQPGARPFDFCDDITSGLSGAVCSNMREGQRTREREVQLKRYADALASNAKAAFDQLRKAQAAFAQASEDKEHDMHGTAAIDMAITARGKMDADFAKDIFEIAEGRMQASGAAGYADLDERLNQTYRKVIDTPSKQEGWPDRIGFSTVTREDVRATQRAWLSFREAWADFLVASASPVAPATIKALLSRRRMEQLAAIPY
jgi:uncharacterized protein YecT (DUF1311 family)